MIALQYIQLDEQRQQPAGLDGESLSAIKNSTYILKLVKIFCLLCLVELLVMYNLWRYLQTSPGTNAPRGTHVLRNLNIGLLQATCLCCKRLLPAFLEKSMSVTVNVNPEKASLATLIQNHCYLHQTWCARR